MKLDDQDMRFLRQRTRWMKAWPAVGLVLFVAVALGGVALFLRTPLVANPAHFRAVVAENLLPPSAVETMASLLPFAILLLFLLMEAMVLFGFTAFFSERRLLRIIDSLLVEDPSLSSSDPETKDQDPTPLQTP
jgi:hypothetical protein